MTDLTRQEVDAKIAGLEAKNATSEARVDARMATFDTSVKTGFAELRTSFAELRTDMAAQNGKIQTQMAELRAEMHKSTVDIIKWVIGVGLASIGAMFTISRMTEKPPVQAAAQPAPIIITIPQAAAPTTTPAPVPTK
ncbi:hypothetical protein INH39_20420 [Massilia violaceinigra]|uniref:DUF1640 domain-containing protein n=1 Tax=Massilia violaceinigra TaxID=2045208 RepID=A0ABY3ZZD7_9BURK|nr:hypothetical protein [Massilia violaceinigra]UOD27843.1 hypothetical protein INH39_20420 [Massilia violaceinigra]